MLANEGLNVVFQIYEIVMLAIVGDFDISLISDLTFDLSELVGSAFYFTHNL
jgi:hypothetical protein